jgi:adenylate kinase
MSELDFIVLTGRFGAGKDTQANLLTQKFGPKAEIISTGDIYRGAKNKTGEFAKYHNHIAPFIEDIDVRGKLLPDAVMVSITKEVIEGRIGEGKNTFLFTGFPRTESQLASFDEMLDNFRKDGVVNSYFVEYKINDQTTLERARQRRAEYKAKGLPPRPEDEDKIVGKRIQTYYRDIEPMIEKLRAEGKLITIDGSLSVREIHTETVSHLKTFRISKEREL